MLDCSGPSPALDLGFLSPSKSASAASAPASLQVVAQAPAELCDLPARCCFLKPGALLRLAAAIVAAGFSDSLDHVLDHVRCSEAASAVGLRPHASPDFRASAKQAYKCTATLLEPKYDDTSEARVGGQGLKSKLRATRSSRMLLQHRVLLCSSCTLQASHVKLKVRNTFKPSSKHAMSMPVSADTQTVQDSSQLTQCKLVVHVTCSRHPVNCKGTHKEVKNFHTNTPRNHPRNKEPEELPGNPTHSALEVVVEVPVQSYSTERAGSRKMRHCQILKTTIVAAGVTSFDSNRGHHSRVRISARGTLTWRSGVDYTRHIRHREEKIRNMLGGQETIPYQGLREPCFI